MSGSNALAAAKRRRGGSQELNKVPPPGSRGLNSQQNQQQAQSQLNPLQLVMINHQRLNSLQSELPKAIDSLGESLNSLSSNCDFLHDNFKTLQDDVNTLKLSKSSNVNSYSQDLDHKLNKLENDISEYHKVGLKTQSFSMDLSSQLMKLKEDYNNLSVSINKRIELLEFNVLNTEKSFNEQLLKIREHYETKNDEFVFKLNSVYDLIDLNKNTNVGERVDEIVDDVIDNTLVENTENQ